MKSKEEFKERLEKDNAFKENFKDVNSTEDFVKKARELGYDITAKDVRCKSLDDDVLENVSGGGDTVINRKETILTIKGNRNKYFEIEF